MKLRATAVVVVMILVSAGRAAAQPPDVSRLGEVVPGLAVTIIDEDGERIDGKVLDAGSDTIRLSRHRAIEEVPIARVVLIEKRDGLKNGAIAGLVVGMSLGVLGGLAAGGDGGILASAIVSQGLVCMAFGIGIDAMSNNRRTIYQRMPAVKKTVIPIVGRRTGGVAIAVSW